ncbi:ATP-binding protein [Ideonella sp. DXS29W]|uniref:histidine kinase n=1 Tax=Ideonella lacteola TaxID=2984193 RepID=A0ABU9BK70_9BURK
MDAGLQECRREPLLDEARALGAAGRQALDALTRTAAQVTQCPIALVSLVGTDHQHFLSRHGWDADGGPRVDSFCTHAIVRPDLMVVPDALLDPRVCGSPLVTGPPFIRAYFGKTLMLDGLAVGTLCVIDQRPRRLSPEQLNALVGLAAGAEAVLTAHRQLQLLQSNTERLTDFAVASGDWYWETDAAGRLSWISSGLAEAWGAQGEFLPDCLLPDTEVTDEHGQRLAGLLPSAPLLRLRDLLDRRARFSRVMIQRGSAAQPRALLLSAVPRHDGGVFGGYRGIARDVSAQALAEREARRASRALERIAAEVPGVIYEFRVYPDGRAAMPYASDNLATLYELRPEEVRNDASAILQRLHPDDAVRVSETVARAAASLTRWRATYRVRLPTRGERVLFAQAMPEQQPDGSVAFYGVISDVTDEVREREQLDAMRIERDTAARSAEARAELMSRVSHELRTPLNAIVGFSQLLRLRFPDTVTEPGRSARHIHHAGEHLLALINDMLDISAIEAGRIEMHPTTISVRSAIDRAIDMVLPQAAERHIKLCVDVAPQVEGVMADERATRQVLLNLLANAIKFGPLDSTVTVKARRHGDDQVDLQVWDEGAGVPVAQRSRLFEPFVRVAAEDRPAGSGLGLTISRKLARLMGGDVTLDDSVSRTCFVLSLPAATLKPMEVADTDFQGLEALPSLRSTRRLLYIEDDPVNALVMEGFMRLIPGVQMEVATTCAQGLIAAQSLPDLIFLDMHLPDGTGFTVLEALKADERTRGIPVVAVSADAMPEQIDAAMRSGFEGYLTKPIDHRSLNETLLRQFERGLQRLLGPAEA